MKINLYVPKAFAILSLSHTTTEKMITLFHVMMMPKIALDS